MLQQQQQLQQLAAAQQAQQQQQQAKQTATTPAGEVVEIDDWLIEFANLFREMSGIDADR
jgi:type II secretory pathway pseudopilin PulG